ncbi:MAG: zinc-binding dehydrogenase, partial [Anaerolineae bacterium]
LGATPIDYRSEDFVQRIRELTGDGVDAAFDPIGADNFKRSFTVLRAGGTLVAYGFYNAAMGRAGRADVVLGFIRLQLWNILPNGRSATLYSIGSWRKKRADWFYEDLTEIFGLLAQGKIMPVIAARMPPSDAARAHELIEQAAVKGKIVLIVGKWNTSRRACGSFGSSSCEEAGGISPMKAATIRPASRGFMPG